LHFKVAAVFLYGKVAVFIEVYGFFLFNLPKKPQNAKVLIYLDLKILC
jgi:hypothetical protein